MASLQEVESKIRRELSELAEKAHGSAHEYLLKERHDREASLSQVSARLEDADRRTKEALDQLIEMRQETGQAAINAMLSLLERKMRDELIRVQDENHCKMGDFKDQVQDENHCKMGDFKD